MMRTTAVMASMGFMALLLGGCVSIGAGGPTPKGLYTLSSEAQLPAGAAGEKHADASRTIKISRIAVPQKLNVTRIPVQVDAVKLAYLQEAVWVEKPARLFTRLLAETMRSDGRWLAVEGDVPGVAVSETLTGTLREFGYDAARSSVVVRFDAVKLGGAMGMRSRRFESTIVAVPPEANAVAKALNQAANDVARQSAEWAAQ